MGRLDGRVALVTGGSRGIGQAIAAAYAREGAKVVITSRKEDGLDNAAAEILEQTGQAVHPIAAHVGKADQLEALFSRIDDEIGIVDVLVNNAATNPYFGPMMGLEWPAWDKTFEVNLKGTWALSREVAKRLVGAGRGGSVINMSSIWGLRGAPWQGAYAMTKAAMISLTRTLALEWGPANIRVNAIAPGLVDTKFASAIVENDAMVKMFVDRTALKRYAQPEEIAGTAVFLASEESAFVTGQVFPVEGGFLSG